MDKPVHGPPRKSIMRRFHISFGLLLCLVTSFAAPSSFAQDSETLYQRATNLYNEALAAAKAGHYHQACSGFNDAADTYESAIYALMRKPMQTEDDRRYVTSVADRIQGDVNDAKASAKAFCGKDDAPTVSYVAPVEEQTPRGPSLEDMITEGKTLSDEAMAAYEAGDQTTSCTKGRRAAEIWAKAYTTLDNTPHADYGSVLALKGNTESSQKFVIDYYCKGQ